MLPSAHARATEWVTAALVMAYINAVSRLPKKKQEKKIIVKKGHCDQFILSLYNNTHCFLSTSSPSSLIIMSLESFTLLIVN